MRQLHRSAITQVYTSPSVRPWTRATEAPPPRPRAYHSQVEEPVAAAVFLLEELQHGLGIISEVLLDVARRVAHGDNTRRDVCIVAPSRKRRDRWETQNTGARDRGHRGDREMQGTQGRPGDAGELQTGLVQQTCTDAS